MKSTKTLKDASQAFCPNLDSPARGKIGAGNIVSHGKERERYTCKMCKKTFGAYQGTMFKGLRKPEELMVIVVTLLAYGCPLKRLCMPCTWTNEQRPDGKSERESIDKRFTAIRSCKPNWICNMCRPMRSEGKAAK